MEALRSMGEEGRCVDENGRRGEECCGSGCECREDVIETGAEEPVDIFGLKANPVPRIELLTRVLEAMMFR